MKREHYRDMIVRTVVGSDPAMTFAVADPAALDLIVDAVMRAESAKKTLRALGYGARGQQIDDAARLVPRNLGD